MKCNNCGAEFSEEAKFCQICGSKIESDTEQAEPAPQEIPQNVCSNCGAAMDENAKFCGVCGAKKETQGKEAPSVYDFSQNTAMPQIEEQTPIYSFNNDNVADFKEKTKEVFTSPVATHAPASETISQPVPEPVVNHAQAKATVPTPVKKPKKKNGIIGLLTTIIVLLVIILSAIFTVVYFGIIDPVDKDSALGKVFAIIGLDEFKDDDSDRDNQGGGGHLKEADDFDDEEDIKNDEEKKTDADNKKYEKEHNYIVNLVDATWIEARKMAKEYGDNTYLASANNIEEFNKLTEMAYNEGIRVLWLGASRDYDESWIDARWEDGTRFRLDEVWFENEPSYYEEDGVTKERYLMAFYVNGAWYLNDSANDVSTIYPGKIGFIIEEER